MAFDLATPLYFFRHGETFYNAEGRIQGQLDTPLSPLGREQACEVGRILRLRLQADGLEAESSGWIASPLSRASETMTIARREMNLPEDAFGRDKRLMELSFGAWQDMTWPEISARNPAAVAARKADFWNFRPPQGESYADLMARCAPWIEALQRDTVAVTHGGVTRVMRGAVLGIDRAMVPVLDVPQDKVLILEAQTQRWL